MNPIEFSDDSHKQDYLSADETTAISSAGYVFKLGDKVMHEGDDSHKVGTIEKFHISESREDVLAFTEHGIGAISFLYK